MISKNINSIGFIGVGALAEYTIEGLRRGGYQGSIWLSPRNSKKADLLAEKYDCKIQKNNQAVVDLGNFLVISTRPEHCLDALAELRFGPEQLLISVVAGIDIDTLRTVIGSGIEIVRAMPVSSAAVGASPTIIYPKSTSVSKLFNICGQAITVPNESAFELGTVLACVYTLYFELFEQLIQANSGKHLPTELARELVLGMAKGAASLALADKSRTPGEIATDIATEGTYSKLGLDLLTDHAAFKPWHDACQLLIERLDQ